VALARRRGPAVLADLPDEQDQHRNDVQHPDRGFEPGGSGGEVEGALEQGAQPRRRADRVAHVEGEAVEPGQDPGLLEVVHAVGEDAGGHQDEEPAGPGEELREVEPQRAAVHEVAERDRGRQSQGGAGERCGGRGGAAGSGLGRGPEEQRGLEAFAADGEHGHDHQAQSTRVSGLVDPAAQVRREPLGGPGHPEDHPGDQPHGEDGQRAADGLLRLEAEAAGSERQDRAERQGDADGHPDPRPDTGEQRPPVGLHEVGHEDDDDQAGLEALAQADEVVRQHVQLRN
jgi:hypothetical protein